MHLAQANTRLPVFLPETKRTHCKFGYFLILEVGLYFPLNLTRVTDIADFFLQIEQTFSIVINMIKMYKVILTSSFLFCKM